ncbi:MAG: class I SAM-dependent methyltransferase [Pirellulales bacterium]
MSTLIDLAERGWIPDVLVRYGIRRLLAERLRFERADDPVEARKRTERFVEELSAGPIALLTQDANAQHYEVPAEFFAGMLGPRRKYSSCLYPAGVLDLASAEEAMLRLTCERAELGDGQEILELGCGWGSLSLWMAERYPRAKSWACRIPIRNARRSWNAPRGGG